MNPNLRTICCWLGRLCLGAVLAVAAAAQEPPVAAGRAVRFIAVGDAPPFRQVVRDGVRYELPPPPGSVPPAEIFIRTTAANAAEEAVQEPLRLQLGRPSKTFPLRTGAAGVLDLRTSKDEGKPWVRVATPESGDLLVVIWRDPEAKTWEQAKATVLPDRPVAGKFTLLNVAQAPVGVVYGAEKLIVVPGKPLVRDLPAGEAREFHIGAPTEAGPIKCFVSMSLEQQAGEHTLLLLCRSDGYAPRQPVKLTVVKNHAVAAP